MQHISTVFHHYKVKVKVKQYHYRSEQALWVPEGWGSQISRQLAHEGGKVVSPVHRPHLPPGNIPGTHFCYRLSRPQGHSVAGRIIPMKKIQWHHRESNPRPSGYFTSTYVVSINNSKYICCLVVAVLLHNTLLKHNGNYVYRLLSYYRKLYILPTQCICLFTVLLTAVSSYFPKQFYPVSRCNGDVFFCVVKPQ
jgi:hypothetical protein